jgi:hypothetical protein
MAGRIKNGTDRTDGTDGTYVLREMLNAVMVGRRQSQFYERKHNVRFERWFIEVEE